MPRRLLLAIVASVLVVPGLGGQSAPPAPALGRDVERLASDEFAGRLTGSPGVDLAGAYIIERLRANGVAPLPGQPDYRVPFEFTAGVKDAGTAVQLTAGEHSQSWSDVSAVQALSFSDARVVSGPIVFAGYGLVVPDGQDTAYDSYAGLDVKDKIVAVLRYFPEDVERPVRATLARYAGLRYKALAARERGAKALVVITGPRSPGAGSVVPMTFDTALAGSGIVAVSASQAVTAALWASQPRTLDAVQLELDTGNPHVPGFDLTGLTLSIDARVARETRTTNNVVGYLPPTTGSVTVSRPYVAIGAHYDHLGRGDHTNSLARQDEVGGIHHGADDNASGVAAVLEAARALAGVRRGRGIVVGFWSGEELGLLGSSAFAASRLVPTEELSAYVNLDMVGRMTGNTLTVQAVGSSAAWPGLLEEANRSSGFELSLQNDPYLPTDSATFNLLSVPTLNFFTGSHEDYHRPTDTAEKINVEGLDRIARFAAAVVERLANAPEAPVFTKAEPKTPAGGGRDAIRVFTGTIPDYTTEVEGLLLGGVVGGGPAEQAGLRKGDVLVEFAGQRIANIYDYTYVLDTVKADVPVTVVFLRDGKRQETTLTPRARR